MIVLGVVLPLQAATAQETLSFYKQELSAFPATNARESRAYASSLADSFSTWATQHPQDEAVSDALLMQARLELRAQEFGKALVTLFLLRYQFPQVSLDTLNPLFTQAVQALDVKSRDTATKLFTAGPNGSTLQVRQADALYALSKLTGKAVYAPAANAFETFFARFADYSASDQVELWYGDLHRLNGNYLAAIFQYKKAGTLYPNTPYRAASERLIGDIYADNLKDTAAATAAYTRVLQNYPDSSETGVVYKHMAILDENNKQYDSALINYDKAIELLGNTPASYEAYRGKADVYIKTKNFTEAYNLLQKTAILFNADEEKATDTWLSAAQLAKRQLRSSEKYIQALEKALLAHPNNAQAPQILFDLGSAYEQQGKTQQAQETYKKLVLKYPTHKLASRAQGRLTKLTK